MGDFMNDGVGAIWMNEKGCQVGCRIAALYKDVVHHIALNIRESEITPSEPVGELRVIHAHEVQHGGMQVGDFEAIFHGVVAPFVGGTIGYSRPHSTACHPDTKTEFMMITTI